MQAKLDSAPDPQRSASLLQDGFSFTICSLKFEIEGEITNIEVIAAGLSVRARSHLRKTHGRGRWRKLKGVATVRVPNGSLRTAELRWYEARGVGKRAMKIKHFLDEQ